MEGPGPPDRAAPIVFGNAAQVAPVHAVETARIDIEPKQRRVGFGQRGLTGRGPAEDLAEVLMDRRVVVDEQNAAAVWLFGHTTGYRAKIKKNGSHPQFAAHPPWPN